MSAFEIVCYVAIAVMAIALLSSLVLLLAVKRDTSKVVLADAVFYPMIAIYLVWTLMYPTRIAYEVVLLGGLLGLLATVSLARIISKGRR